MPDELRYYRSCNVEKPVLIAGWTGMGSVALQTVDFLRNRLNAKLFAEVDIGDLIYPDSVLVETGLAKLPSFSRNLFYICEEHGLILFESGTQVAGQAGTVLLERIIDLACDTGVERIFTGAAFPLPISHNEPSSVYMVANDGKFRDELYKSYSLKKMNGGQISGLNGLLLGYALKRGIKAACLLATLPLYAVNFPNPKASLSVVKILQKILDFQVDTKDLDRAVLDMDSQMEVIEKKMKSLVRIEEDVPKAGQEKGETQEDEPENEAISGVQTEGVPSMAIERIERLFKKAIKDRQMAFVLKEELDRWNLFKLYEDRFLDLFREKH